MRDCDKREHISHQPHSDIHVHNSFQQQEEGTGWYRQSQADHTTQEPDQYQGVHMKLLWQHSSIPHEHAHTWLLQHRPATQILGTGSLAPPSVAHSISKHSRTLHTGNKHTIENGCKPPRKLLYSHSPSSFTSTIFSSITMYSTTA